MKTVKVVLCCDYTNFDGDCFWSDYVINESFVLRLNSQSDSYNL